MTAMLYTIQRTVTRRTCLDGSGLTTESVGKLNRLTRNQPASF